MNGASCRRAYGPLSYGVRHPEDLFGVFIQKQVIVTKVTSTDVPVEVLVSSTKQTRPASN